jgi:hypothetical protein
MGQHDGKAAERMARKLNRARWQRETGNGHAHE